MRRIILVLTAALILAAMTVAAAPAMAAQEKTVEKTTKTEEKDKGKDKDLPKSGGVSINASLIGLGAGVLLVGGGLVAIRISRQDRS